MFGKDVNAYLWPYLVRASRDMIAALLCEGLKRMADKTPTTRRGGTIGAVVLGAVAAPLATAALEQATKLAKAMADRRGKPKLRNEVIYRNLDKVRVIGEAALTLDSEGHDDERQRLVVESAVLRDALHEQLVDLQLSSAAQKPDLLDAAQTAIGDADRLVAVLNKWALNSSDAGQTRALQQAVQAITASENALLSCMKKAHRGLQRKGQKRGASDDKSE
jgi:hypothetical protein